MEYSFKNTRILRGFLRQIVPRRSVAEQSGWGCRDNIGTCMALSGERLIDDHPLTIQFRLGYMDRFPNSQSEPKRTDPMEGQQFLTFRHFDMGCSWEAKRLRA